MSNSETGLGRWAWASAAILLGYAVQLANGALHPDAIPMLAAALVLAVVAVASVHIGAIEERLSREGGLLGLLAAGLVFQFGTLLTAPPGIYLQLRSAADFRPFYFGLAAAALVSGACLGHWAPRLRAPLLLTVHLVLGVWLIHASPRPFIDVYVFQKDAIAALFAGQNPYAMTFPDIYGNSPFYGPGLSVGGRLSFGFPYPPLSLLMSIPGQVLGGDYRYGQLLSMTLAGGLMAYARPGRTASLATALFLFTPRSLFVLEQGWTEPFVVVLLALVVFAACRAPRVLPWAFGLLLAVKQYMVFAPALGVLLFPKPWPPRRALAVFAGKAVGIAALITMPLFLWNPKAFWHSVVALQTVQPFRSDALSFLAYSTRDGSPPLPTSLAFVAVLVAVGLALWRAPRTPAGFAGAMALTYAAFFAFNKQAFCNYYYFVIGACCCALAASAPADGSTEAVSEELEGPQRHFQNRADRRR
ncbi:MAG: hypothetical protein ACT4TC_26425 [Myxococcaceae bacterium]